MDHLLVLSRANERQPSRGKQYKSLEMLPNSGSATVFTGEAAGTPATEPFKNKKVLSVLLGPCLPTAHQTRLNCRCSMIPQPFALQQCSFTTRINPTPQI